MDLFVQVSRDPDGRLKGNVVPAGSAMSRSFSGTLELLRVLEDIVIPVSGDDEIKRKTSLSQGTTRRQP